MKHDKEDIYSPVEDDEQKKNLPPKKRIRRTKEELKTNYVDPIDMELKIIKFYETNIFSSELADMIQKIATRLGYAQNFINYCVDEKTEALTQRGFLNVNEINIETDKIRSYDLKTKSMVWGKINEIFTNPNYNGIMHYLFHSDFNGKELLNAGVTPNHKFVTERGLVEFSQLQYDDIIILNEITSIPFNVISIDTIQKHNKFIWCPITEYGNFLCRKEGVEFLTGNSYKEEMIGDAVIKMVTALNRRRFMCRAGYNPFSYFTKVAFRAFQNRIKKEKKDHDTIKRYQESVYNLLTESGQIPYQKNGKGEYEDTSYDESQEVDID